MTKMFFYVVSYHMSWFYGLVCTTTIKMFFVKNKLECTCIEYIIICNGKQLLHLSKKSQIMLSSNLIFYGTERLYIIVGITSTVDSMGSPMSWVLECTSLFLCHRPSLNSLTAYSFHFKIRSSFLIYLFLNKFIFKQSLY